MKPFLPACRIAAASLIMAATLQAQAESMQIGCYLFEYTKSGATVKSADSSLINDGKAVIPATINVDGMTVPVTGIESSAFSKVEQLDSLIIEDSDRPLQMGGYALDDAAYHYYIGRNLEELENRPSFFRGSAVSIEFGDKVTSLEGFGSSYFYGSENLEKVVIGSGLKRIPDDCFRDCPKLAELNLPEGLEYLGTRFAQNSALTSIRVPGTVKNIPEDCFRDCSSLSELILSEGVESLGRDILYGSPLVTTLHLPSTVTSVDRDFISKCNVNEVWFKSAVPPAGLQPFDSRKSATVYVPMEGYKAYHDALYNNGNVTLYACNADNEIVATYISISDFPGQYLHQGDVVTLSATVEPQIAVDKNVTWTSSDPSVATVDDNGTVTAVAPGFVEITATLACGATSATSRIEVLAPGVPELPLIGELNLYPETFVTAWGDMQMYCKDVDPDKWRDRFEWVSSDENVIKIVESDGGNVTVRPVAPGESGITIRSVDQPEKSATAIWKVYAPDITVRDIPATVTVDDIFKGYICTNTIDSVYGLDQTLHKYELLERMRNIHTEVTISDDSVIKETDNATDDSELNFLHVFSALKEGTAEISFRIPEYDLESVHNVKVQLPLISEFDLYPEVFVTAWGDVEMYCNDVDYTQWRDRFEWTSSDESVIKIVDYNAGKATVRPVAPGKSEITIRSIDQPEKSASAIWKVYAPDLSVSGLPSEIYTDDEFRVQIHTNALDSIYRLSQTFQNYEIQDRMMELKVDLTLSDNSVLQHTDREGDDYEKRFFHDFKAIKAGETGMTIRLPELDKVLQLPITVKARVLKEFSISLDRCSSHVTGVEHTASITEYPHGSNATYKWSVAAPDSVRLLDTRGSTVRFIPLLEGAITIKAECVENPAISRTTWIHAALPDIGIKGNTQFEVGDTDFGNITGNFWDCADSFTEEGTEYPVILENSNPEVIELEGVEQNRFYNLRALRPGRATITARLRGTDCVARMEVRVGGTEVYSLDLAVLVRPGASVMLDASCNPADAYDRSVTWRSSDEAVATVADGIVTGINAGRATITARSNDNPDVTATIPVRVVPSALTGFSIMPTAIQATPGDRVEITTTFTPAEARQPIEWHSSDKTVASVHDGIVNIESEGTCVITATPASNPELKAECTVSVTASVESYFESPDTEADIYNLAGCAVLRNATREYAMRLAPGIYIINGRPYYKH